MFFGALNNTGQQEDLVHARSAHLARSLIRCSQFAHWSDNSLDTLQSSIRPSSCTKSNSSWRLLLSDQRRLLPSALIENMSASTVEAALQALREGKPVCILDARNREGETDIYFSGLATHAPQLRMLRTAAGGELYIAVGHEVSQAFGLPYAGRAMKEAAAKWPVLAGMGKCDGEMCQGSCSVGVSLDHRSTKTGAPDDERSLTVRRLAELYQEVHKQQLPVQEAAAKLGAEFHLPGHIFLCQENPKGLLVRRGHTELSVALAKAAGIVPVLVGCVMLSNSGDDYGALSPDAAAAWAQENGVPFVEGPAITEFVLGSKATAAAANGNGSA